MMSKVKLSKKAIAKLRIVEKQILAELTKDELDKLEALASQAAVGEWCSDWCYSAIRHVCRNCDIECGTHGDGGPEKEDCVGFGRYDGPYIAYANPDRIKRLIAMVRERAQ